MSYTITTTSSRLIVTLSPDNPDDPTFEIEGTPIPDPTVDIVEPGFLGFAENSSASVFQVNGNSRSLVAFIPDVDGPAWTNLLAALTSFSAQNIPTPDAGGA